MNHRFLSAGTLSCVCLLSTGARAQWSGLTDASGPLNTSSFSFGGTNPLAGTTNENYYDGDLGDVDGDGLADRMLGSRYGLLVNQGGGLMKVARTYLGFLLRGDPGASGWGEDAAQFADLDGDGDLDGLMGGNGEPISAQRNSEGRFSISWVYTAGNSSALNIVNTDLERDGDVDLVVAHAFCSNSACGGPVNFALFQNDGAGNIAEVSAARGLSYGGTDFIVGAASGDVDRDGDFDLVIAVGGAGELVVALNNGGGSFTPRGTGIPTTCSGFGQGLNLGDIDDDGDLDIVAGRCGAPYSGGHADVSAAIGINDGSANFTDESAARWSSSGWSGDLESENAKLVDIDYDGDLDFIAFAKNNQTARMHFQVFLNDGTGSFAYDTANSWETAGPSSGLGSDVDVSDLDGDGIYDVWVGVSGTDVRILLNDHVDSAGLAGDVPRNVRVESAEAGAITLAWTAPPFAATARRYRVYRAMASRLADGDRQLVKDIAFSVHQDEGFSAPITRHTTTAELGDPDVTLDGLNDEVRFIDRTAVPGVTYYYSVSHVGTEADASVQSAEVCASLPGVAPATDTTRPALTIVGPTAQGWSALPRIALNFADGESGIDPTSLRVSFNQALGGGARPANADVTDLAYRKDDHAFIAYLTAGLELPQNTLVTMTASVADNAGNTTTETVQFFPAVSSTTPPTASFSGLPATATAPASASLDATASSDDGMILRWEWYFGDGTTAAGRQVEKTFEYGGTYDVTLRAVDNLGGTATTTHSITVTGPAAPAPACDPGMPPTTGADAGAADAGSGGAAGAGGAAGSLPDGSVVLPDGAIRLPDGAVIAPPQADAGDAGVSSNSEDDSGCGCKLTRSASSETALGAVVALAGLTVRRRRRQSGRAHRGVP